MQTNMTPDQDRPHSPRAFALHHPPLRGPTRRSALRLALSLAIALPFPCLTGCVSHSRNHKNAPSTPEPDLVAAARAGDAAKVRQLLDSGANINLRGHRGMTPLMAAAAMGRTATVQLLLARGADANARGAKGKTAREWAIAQGHPDIAHMLRDAEVEPPRGPANPIPAPPIAPPATAPAPAPGA